MLRSITVTNHLGESLTIEMQRPTTSGFYIKKIEGLGPVKANINIAERAIVDGGQFFSAHANSRNIVITLGFLFAHNVEDVRHKSYKYFPLKKKIKLVVETDRRTCETYGYVESNEPDIFSKEETTQISIICPDPYFYSTKNTVTTFFGIEPMFEFPFSNESLTDDEIEFGNMERSATRTIFYSGEVEVGVTIVVHAVGDASNLMIANFVTGETMKIGTSRLDSELGSGIMAGDDIIISTVKGEKSIQLLRDGVYHNILNCLDKQSDWFQLSIGENTFAYVTDSGYENLQFRVENRMAYEGV